MCRIKTIELIVPCYNEEKCVALFYDAIVEVFKELREYRTKIDTPPQHSDELCDYRMIITYVDDGSSDDTLNEIKRVAGSADLVEVQYIALSRNFGKESAIYAGLSRSRGDYVALMDADLQHPPKLLIKMLDAIEKEGCDRATARRVSRKGEPLVRSTLSKAFYHIINHITVIDLVPGSTDYCLMKRSVVESIVSMGERERFTKGIYAWVGFRNKWIEYENVERAAGKTKWNIRRLFHYAYSGFIAFATTPLRGIIYLGIIITIGAFIYAVQIGIATYRNPLALRNGYTTIMITLLFLGGVIITTLGMIGEYLARIYMEVKKRPIYIERETNISSEKETTGTK